jgi:hypothetical protein
VNSYALRLKPILDELDRRCAWDFPVSIDLHLVPIFAEFTAYKSIELIPIKSGTTTTSLIKAIHVSSSDGAWAKLFYRACGAHEGLDADPACPECQHRRLRIAKEMVHLVDAPEQKTAPNEFDVALLAEACAGNLNANAHVEADAVAIEWAVELLVRYRQCIGIAGRPEWLENAVLKAARDSGDFSYFAPKFGVPSDVLRYAFSANRLSIMKELREQVGLSIEIPAWFCSDEFNF